MHAEQILEVVSNKLAEAFESVEPWFNVKDELLDYVPKPGAWSVRQILEHISLTNHFLLILIKKGATKALQLAPSRDLADELSNFSFDADKLKAIGERGAFEWNRPEHMEPTGKSTSEEVSKLLKTQLAECLQVLESLKNGEGVLYKTTMSVNGLGKISVYEYIYF